MMNYLRAAGLATLVSIAFAGCTAQGTQRAPENSVPQNGMNQYQPQGQDEQEVLNAQAAQMRKAEVTLSGRVFKMLPDDTRGLPHELWLMKLSNGTTVKIAHDTKLAPRIPLSDGDLVRLHGEYIWNEKGGVIHWTHHDPRHRHEPGWVDFNGQRYE
jgi:hypothetical protein